MWDGRAIHTTERLLLRTFREADLPAIAAINGDEEVMRWLGGALTPAASDKFVTQIEQYYERHGLGMIAVERRADGAFVGLCGLSRLGWYPDDLEIGFRLAPAHWGNGYATEAARAWVNHAFRMLGAPRVISVADVPNTRSIAVMGRLGLRFDHEAELLDGDVPFRAAIYAIDAAHWLADAAG